MSRASVEKIEFEGAGGDTLAARLDRPAREAWAYALFAHCFTCSKDVLAASRISSAMARQGIAVLRFDFTGLGASGGEFANTDFSSNVADLVAAANYLEDHHRAPSILVGHSLGGTAVIAAASKLPAARAVATVGAPADPEHVRHLLHDDIPRIEARGEAEVEIAGRSFRIRKEFLDDIARQSLRDALSSTEAALLLFHSPQDRVVEVDNARLLFEAARHPKSFISLDGADHLLTDRADAEYVGTVLAGWATRYLGTSVSDPAAVIGSGAPADEEPARPAAAGADDRPATPGERDRPEGVVRVREVQEGTLTQEIRVDAHRFLADEPREHGGDERGPTPYQLLAAGLGACTGMTLRMYADRKEWPLDGVTVGLRHEKIHAKDCEQCETQTGKLDRIERTLEIRGDLDDGRLDRLLEIADRCPVHRTLHGEVQVVTHLAEREPTDPERS